MTNLVGRRLEHRNALPPLESLVRGGIIADTIEVAAPWAALPGLYQAAIHALGHRGHDRRISPPVARLPGRRVPVSTFAGQPGASGSPPPRRTTVGPGTQSWRRPWRPAGPSLTTTASASTGPATCPSTSGRRSRYWLRSRRRSIRVGSSTRANWAVSLGEVGWPVRRAGGRAGRVAGRIGPPRPRTPRPPARRRPHVLWCRPARNPPLTGGNSAHPDRTTLHKTQSRPAKPPTPAAGGRSHLAHLAHLAHLTHLTHRTDPAGRPRPAAHPGRDAITSW